LLHLHSRSGRKCSFLRPDCSRVDMLCATVTDHVVYMDMTTLQCKVVSVAMVYAHPSVCVSFCWCQLCTVLCTAEQVGLRGGRCCRRWTLPSSIESFIACVVPVCWLRLVLLLLAWCCCSVFFLRGTFGSVCLLPFIAACCVCFPRTCRL
jgi:hypothetical protein